MRKKQKNIVVGSIILLAIIFILAQTGNLKYLAVYGPSYLSISKIDNVGVGSEFLIYATGGSAERLKIEWSASQINEQIKDDGYMVNRGVSADIYINKWQHTYPIQLTENSYKTIGIQDLKSYLGSEFSCDLSDCSSTSVPKMGTYILSYAYEMSSIPLKYNCKCVYYNPSDKVGQFLGDLQTLNWNIDFSLEGETKSMNNQVKQVSLKNGNFRAEYVGNLGTEFQRSKPGYSVKYSEGQYTNLVPFNGYSYFGKYGSIANPSGYFSQCKGSIDLSKCTWLANGCTDEVNLLSGCYNQYISDLNVGASNKDSEYKSGNQVKSMSFSGNNLIVDSEIPTFQPTFKIFINANWIGLEELKGEPQITNCAPSVSIDGGMSKQVSISVKNIGSNDGQFDYSVTCDNLDVSYSGSGGYVTKGTIETFSLLFSGSNDNPDADLKGSCTHKFTDRKSGKTSSCISSYTVKYSGYFCNAGELRCSLSNSKVIERCDNLGMKWETYKNCEGVCEFKDNVIQCSGESPPPGDNECSNCDAYAKSVLFGDSFNSYKCKPRLLALPPQTNTTCVFSFLKLFLVPIIFIISLIFGNNFLRTNRNFKIKNKGIRIIVNILIAGILAYLIYTLFWTGVIISIIYLGVTILFKKLIR